MDSPARALTLSAGEAHLWLARPELVEDEALKEAARTLLSPDERERMARYHFEKDRRLHLVARALVRRTLSRYEPVASQAWRFGVSAQGRPEIASPATSLDFNVSHTDGLVACVVTRGAEVGVDVERVRPERATPALAARVFAPAERAELAGLSGRAHAERFFTLWTLKEAYLKARGLGLRLPLRALEFRIGAGSAVALTLGPGVTDDAATWHFEALSLGEHRGAVALRRAGREARPVLSVHETRLADDEA